MKRFYIFLFLLNNFKTFTLYNEIVKKVKGIKEMKSIEKVLALSSLLVLGVSLTSCSQTSSSNNLNTRVTFIN